MGVVVDEPSFDAGNESGVNQPADDDVSNAFLYKYTLDSRVSKGLFSMWVFTEWCSFGST